MIDVICGDCLHVMPGLGQYDLVIADPPFNVGWDGYDHTTDKLDDYPGWSRDWMTQVYDRLQANGTFWLAMGDEWVSELDMIAKSIGFVKRSHVVWYYSFGNALQHNFSRSHDHWLYYVKNRFQHTFNADAIRVESWRLKNGDKRARPEGKLPDNTWTFNRICGTHPERIPGTIPQTPEALVERAILSTSNPGDKILDPFSGTGTVPAVAKRHGRDCTAIEISQGWCDKISERLK